MRDREHAVVRIPRGTWVVDPEHSSVEFEVKNLGYVTVTGYLGEFEGTLVADGNGVRAWGSARTESINTRVAERDEDLRSDDFFAADRFPEIRFEGDRFELAGADGSLRVVGTLEIKGRERRIQFDGRVGGPFVDHQGNTRLALDLRGTVNRMDLGIDWDGRGPDGAKMASDEVAVILHLGMPRTDEEPGR
jgi:polyisoprenoid-binding protein YceI